jgi:hypothetical protein
MPGKNKHPMLGWHPPAELSAWARDEAERRGGKGELSNLLTEALGERRVIPELISALRTMKDGGLPDVPGSDDLLDELIGAAYLKGLEDAQ